MTTHTDQAPHPLEIDGLSIRFPDSYGQVSVLDQVSLTVDRGEGLGVVGESGSGKSLLGLATLGMLPEGAQSWGRVRVAGHEMIGQSEKRIAPLRGEVVSYVYQDALSALNPTRRVGHQFRDVWRAVRSSRAEDWREVAREALERVALRDPDAMLRSYPGELSGGMRQRVLIALAVARRPQLLIADEPTTALDRATGAQVLDLLRELKSDLGMALVLISHDLTVAQRACEKVAVMYAGQLCEFGSIDTVVPGPRHQYTRALLRAVESLDRGVHPLASIPGVVPPPPSFSPGCRFSDRCIASVEECSRNPAEANDGDRSYWCWRPVDAKPS